MDAARGTGVALIVIGVAFLASAAGRHSTIGIVAGVMLMLAGVLRLMRARGGPPRGT